MKAPAFLQGSESATRRAERVAKTLSVAPEPASNVSDPIDEQIASLLESVSSKLQAQTTGMNSDVRPDRVVAREGLWATASRRYRNLVDAPRSSPARTVPRPHRLTVRQALSGIAIELPRPYRSYIVRRAFSLIAIALCGIAIAFLIVYFMPA